MDTTAEVVIVDDEQAIRDLVVQVLTNEGYHVLTAPNGAVALELIRTSSPSVILLDLQMPVMGGPEFIKRYRQLPTPHAPIVVMSSALRVGRSFNLHGHWVEIDAEGYLRKPFDLDALLRLVTRLARRRVPSLERISISLPAEA